MSEIDLNHWFKSLDLNQIHPGQKTYCALTYCVSVKKQDTWFFLNFGKWRPVCNIPPQIFYLTLNVLLC